MLISALNRSRDAIVFIRGGTLSAHSARPRKIHGWIVLEKCVKYANEMTNDVIHSTKFYIKYKDRALLVNLHCRPLKLSRLIALQETHLQL